MRAKVFDCPAQMGLAVADVRAQSEITHHQTDGAGARPRI
jgi:hypothetical protein